MKGEFTDLHKFGRPTWYDENGTPRFCRFHPYHVSNIYAKYVCYILVGCQHCKLTWRVATSINDCVGIQFPTIGEIGSFHYGDPPNHIDTDHAGSTMNSIPIKVLQFWKKDYKKNPFWQRLKKFEINTTPEWAIAYGLK